MLVLLLFVCAGTAVGAGHGTGCGGGDCYEGLPDALGLARLGDW